MKRFIITWFFCAIVIVILSISDNNSVRTDIDKDLIPQMENSIILKEKIGKIERIEKKVLSYMKIVNDESQITYMIQTNRGNFEVTVVLDILEGKYVPASYIIDGKKYQEIEIPKTKTIKSKYYDIKEIDTNMYQYFIYDTKGNIILDEVVECNHLSITKINDEIIVVRKSYGTKASLTRYFNIKLAIKSDEYQNVLASNGKVFTYVDENNKLVVQNIFNKGLYYKTFDLDLCEDVSAINGLQFKDDNKIIVTYCKGANKITKTSILEI